MSLGFYCRRLHWDGRVGVVKVLDMTIELRHAPPVFGDSVAELDYGEAASGQVAYNPMIREHAYDRMREMEAAEITRVKAWLEELHSTMSDALKRR